MHKAKPSTPTEASDVRMGEEEKNQKEEEKKETESYLDHSVTSYDPYGSIGGLILKSPQPTQGTPNVMQ